MKKILTSLFFLIFAINNAIVIINIILENSDGCIDILPITNQLVAPPIGFVNNTATRDNKLIP